LIEISFVTGTQKTTKYTKSQETRLAVILFPTLSIHIFSLCYKHVSYKVDNYSFLLIPQQPLEVRASSFSRLYDNIQTRRTR